MNEATAFVENMLLKDEAEPLPQRFTNAVHNALTAQVAIELGAKGLNSTPSCHEVSFEVALWHATQELRAGTTTLALAGAADEVNPHAVAVGKRWSLPPLGEGAAVVALTATSTMKPLGYLETIRLGRGTGNIAAEVRWLAETLSVEGLELLLTNSRGLTVTAAWQRLTGKPITVESYSQSCGEHYAASALGFVTALRMLDRYHRIAVYTVGVNGVKGLCVLGR